MRIKFLPNTESRVNNDNDDMDVSRSLTHNMLNNIQCTNSKDFTSVQKCFIEGLGQVNASAVVCITWEPNIEAESSDCVDGAVRRAMKQETLVEVFVEGFVEHVETWTVTVWQQSRLMFLIIWIFIHSW